MNDAAAILATFCNIRIIGGRKVIQMHFEAPLEHGDRILEVFGLPDPANPKWCGIALVEPPKQ